MNLIFVLVSLFVLSHSIVAETVHPAPPGLQLRMRPNQTSSDGEFAPREVLLSLQRAYPRRVREVAWREADWAVRVDEQWFLWAGGRLLPHGAVADADLFDPMPFYRYETGPFVAPVYTDAERTKLEERAADLDRDPPRRHSAFLNALWRIDDRSSSYDRQKTTFFLGMKTMVHRDLLEDLAAVEEEILLAMEDDATLAAFVRNLRSVEGYNFRRVDGTATLSNHSYGIAVDLLPASYGGRQVYWRWARDGRVDWLGLSETDRFAIPPALVAAFEAHGFVWGGKWRFFDIIHFEYRPEILILNGADVELR